MTIKIPLTRGYVAIVDDEDADLAECKWSACETDNTTYAKGSGKYARQLMHRVICSRLIGRELHKREIADHIDRNGLSNTRGNLRAVTPSQSCQNRKMPSHNTSGYKGVYWDERRQLYRARIGIGGKKYHLGYRAKAKDAHDLYRTAVEALHQEYACFD